MITIPKAINHFPWADEAHAWLLARIMNFSNIIEILKNEGHFVIWYLVLMPFAKLHIGYPYSMLTLNWIFYFLALLVMWKKAPFNLVIKLLITFSWISLNYFSIVARCYSIGVLGIFLILSIYEEQLKKPFAYSSLLVLTAHTSFLSTIAVIPLGCIFIYNLLKNVDKFSKRKLCLVGTILVLGIILWIFPFIHGYGYPNLLVSNAPRKIFIFDFWAVKHYAFLIFYVITLGLTLLYSNAKGKFVITLPIVLFLWFFSNIFAITPHHAVFLLVYLIVGLWLTPRLHKYNGATIVYIVVLSFVLFFNQSYCFSYILENPNKTDLVKFLNSQEDKQYLVTQWVNSDIEPFLDEKYKIIIVDQILPKKSIDKNKEILELLNKKNYYRKEGYYTCYILSSEKLNRYSVPIVIYSKKQNYILYVSKYAKNNEELKIINLKNSN